MRDDVHHRVRRATRALLFAGKGGVGKTSLACAFAVALADAGRRTLLVSTDPASNLDEVLGVRLGLSPVDVPGVVNLRAQNLDPVAAARRYREQVVAPLRGALPNEAIASVEEQLSGACAVEIAAFDEFSRLLADKDLAASCDHVVFDTAPTGHTLRLLELPAAWTRFLNASGDTSSCLGPLSGLAGHRALYEAARRALADPTQTTLFLVARPETSALDEAARSLVELEYLGIKNVELLVNGVFTTTDKSDTVAAALERRGRRALKSVPKPLGALPSLTFPLRATAPIGIAELRDFLEPASRASPTPRAAREAPLPGVGFDELVDAIASSGRGVVMTMGKGGVGKTTFARRIARALARRGVPVHLTTTDPAGRSTAAGAGIRCTRIDAKEEVARYAREVLDAARALDAPARALLEEELRSPCTEEVAVFRALSRIVAEGEDGFTVVDTAPTGHTLLLLDAAGHYHQEVLRTSGASPDSVRRLLPRLRDPSFTKVVIVTLPEATPVHEAAALQDDLRRAGIEPFAWVVNQSLSATTVLDPLLVARRAEEQRYLREVAVAARRMTVVPWMEEVEVGEERAEAVGSMEGRS